MPNTYTPRLRLVQQETGSNTNFWGVEINASLTSLVDEAISGIAKIDMSGGDVTLSTLNGGTDQARMAVLEFFGNVADANAIVPVLNKLYLVRNTQAARRVTLTTQTPAEDELIVLPQTSVWAQVLETGAVQAVSVPVSIGGAGGIEVLGRFATPAFEDVGDESTRLLRLKDAGGVELNPDGSDEPVQAYSESGISLLYIITKDAGAGNTAEVRIGNTVAPVVTKGDLVFDHASKTNFLRFLDRSGSFLLTASDGQADGSSIAVVGDQFSATPSAQGDIEFSGSADNAVTPTLRITGFRGGALVDGNSIWHAGNDGSGSGLDADRLGGFDNSEFLRLTKTTTQTAVGRVDFDDRVVFRHTDPALEIKSTFPALELEKEAPGGGTIQRWQLNLNGAVTENLTVTRGGANNVSVELDKGEDQLYRGPKGNADPYLSLKGAYVGTDGGQKGYLQIGNIYIQYGEVQVSAGTFENVTLPTAFPTACRSVVLTFEWESGDPNPDRNPTYEILSQTTIRIHNPISNNKRVSWLAMGD